LHTDDQPSDGLATARDPVRQQEGGGEMTTAWKEATVTLDGCRINVLRGGKGEPLLFLHGAGGGGAWLPFMEDLAQRFDVIAPEHPGFGKSDTPDWFDGIHDLVFFYLDFLAAEGLAGVHLVGTSLGGWLAAEMAMVDAARLKTLTLVAPAGLHVKGVKKADIFLWPPEELARHLFHDPALAEAEAKRAVDPAGEDARMKNRYATARLAWQPRFYDPLLMKWLKRVTLPTLILWGEEDRILPSAHAPAFHEMLRHSHVELIPNCGHLPHIECKDAFVASVTRFIEGARR
jgi:pimeloyl-ACP methyl ester carboxylesterase